LVSVTQSQDELPIQCLDLECKAETKLLHRQRIREHWFKMEQTED
jgi:hypothetical protein